MARASKTFSESWYRVANLKVSLRPEVRVHRQHYRGERWYVLRDPFNNQFFRVRAPGYAFIARLDGRTTVQEAWEASLEADPDNAPGQVEATRLLAQLYHGNLIHSDVPADATKLFKRFRKRRQREVQSKALSFMFVRIPLWDPDAFLKWALPVARRIFSPVGAIVWLAVVALAVKTVVDHFPELMRQGREVLAPGNLFLLYASLVGIKVLHEFGHAFLCRKFGGEVHTMGVIFLVFTPLPYMDATSSWAFRNRWHRILVGAGGMIVELFVAALATFVWAATGPGALNSLAFNMMFVASVSTLLFNLNPLLRFDGYYIFSDLLNIPNLYSRGQNQLKFLCKRWLYGLRNQKSFSHSRYEEVGLPLFGVASLVYRVFVFSVILLFVADRFLLLGLLLAFFCLIAWLAVPLGKLVHYLASNPELDRTRVRAIAWTAVLAGTPLLIFQTVPVRHGFLAPGIVQATEYEEVLTRVPGFFAELLVPSGEWVSDGQPLFRLANPELEFDLNEARALLDEAVAQRRRALREAVSGLEGIEAYIIALEQRIRHLEEERANLLMRTRTAGRWIAPEAEDLEGVWLPRGTMVGRFVDDRSFRFIAVVTQTEASRLFSDEIRGAAVRVRGQSERTIPVAERTVLPGQRQRLPSAALGLAGGGELMVRGDDESGRFTEEPFFEVRADLNVPEGVRLYHGQQGRLRFQLAPSPLLPRWLRAFQQLLQDRYGLG